MKTVIIKTAGSYTEDFTIAYPFIMESSTS